MNRVLLVLSFCLSLIALSAQEIRTVDEYIIDRQKDTDGREIEKIIVPGKPPDGFRMPAVYPTRSSSTLPDVPAYDWSFGCSATAAAMHAGYYDRTSQPNVYTGPMNGGVAPMDNSGWGTVIINGQINQQCPISATRQGLDGRTGRGHVDDYWVQSGSTSTDPFITNGWTEHTYSDCTGDFMKTNQSTYDNSDGTTTFYYYSDGDPYSGNANGDDGMYGLKLFYESRGLTVISHFNQYIYGHNGNTLGFTFAQYKQEIDAGRPVLIQVTGHTMLGYGYDDAGTKVYLHDTWDYSNHMMTWGGSYSGLQHYGVGVIQLASNQYCLTCPNQDYTITPTTSWTTHSSSHETYGCKIYKLNVIAGSQYTFKTGCGDGATANYNTYLELLNASCSQITSNNDGCESNRSKIVWTANFTGYAYVKVSGYQNNSGEYTLAYTYCTPPDQPGIISGNTSVCQGSSQTYSVSNVTGVSYAWQVPSGWTITAGQGSNSITTAAGAVSGNVSVIPSNSCGNGVQRSQAVTVNTVPAQPSVISGLPYPCQGTAQSYSVTNAAGITYTWQVPADWTITSGQGTHSISATVGETSGNVQVLPTNACGDGPLRTFAATVVTVPDQPSAITGPGVVCQGSAPSYSVGNVTGVTYLWQVPEGWTINSGQGSASVAVTAGALSGTVQVTPSNACGNGDPGMLAVTVNAVPAQSSAVSGEETPCLGSNQAYSVIPVAGVTYTWILPADWPIITGQGTGSITTAAGSSSGNVQVTPSNDCGNGPSSTLGITVIPIPEAPSAISGETQTCLGSSQSYSVIPVEGVTYTWTVPDDWAIQTGQGTHSIAALVGESDGTIEVTPSNGCGNGTPVTMDVTVNAVPSGPTAITGDESPCLGSTQTYSVNPVPDVVYSWSVPGDWTITDGQFTHTMTTIVGASTGTIGVVPSNSCGDGIPGVLEITMVPTVPGQPSPVVGEENPCRDSYQTYSVLPEADVTYTWFVPNGWTITEGDGTHSITAMVGIFGGTVEVIPSKPCGDGPPATLGIEVNSVPSQPSAITGLESPCQGSTQTYSVEDLPGLNYTWFVPGDWTIMDGQGTGAITTIAGAYGGQVQVMLSNECGDGAIGSLEINVITVPGPPSAISGPENPCQGSTQTYSVDSEPGMTYTWFAPADWAITAGQGTNTVTAIVGEYEGEFVVIPMNECGDGAPGILEVAVATLPHQPSPISGPSYVCQSQGSVVYSVPPVAGAESYVWDYSGTGAILHNEEDLITIDFSSTATSGNLTVFGVNTCGNGPLSDELSISLIPLPSVYAGADQTIANGTATTITDATASGFGSMTYSWAPSEAFVDASVLHPTTVNLYATTLCTLIVTDEIGCTQSAQVNITVTGGALVALPTADPFFVCSGETSHLFTNAQGGSGIYTYSWTSDPEGFNSNESNPYIALTETTTYYVLVDDGFNTFEAEVTVVVNTLPVVICPEDLQVLISDPAFPLTGATPSGGVYTGEGVSNGLFDPAAAGIGNHSIIYTVEDLNGCMNACEFLITVEEDELFSGDANIDDSVNVLDIITITNYIMWLNPDPFSFDNADTNDDQMINVLDIIGTVNIIMAP